MMMMNQRRNTLLVTLLIVSAAWTSAFAPFSRCSMVISSPKGIQRESFMASLSPLYMSEEPKGDSAESDGTFYDDEVEPAPKDPLSDSMRSRLMAEASTGLDPDKKQTNVILYIMLGIAVLVILGGAGIFY